MSELSFQQQAVLWGQAYEVLVKRGVLAVLLDRGLVAPDAPALTPWRDLKVGAVTSALTKHLHLLDETEIERVRRAVEHLAVVAFGLGYTAMREYLKPLTKALELKQLAVRALWCPLQLPGPRTSVGSEMLRARTELNALLGIGEAPDPTLSEKGAPANADFFVWLSGQHKEDHLLVQEYSYDMPPNLGDFALEDAHIDELTRHRRFMDSRSVFARVAAEVEQERFDLSTSVSQYLGALTSDNKPFYKLCQAASYAHTTVEYLAEKSLLAKPCVARALAITPNGLESLAASVVPGKPDEARLLLMKQMGEAYRKATKIADGDTTELANQVKTAFNAVLRRLPRELYSNLVALRDQLPEPGEDYEFEFEEEVPAFANPMQMYSRDEALAMVDDDPAVAEYLNAPARDAIGEAIQELVRDAPDVSLRDLHAAAVVASLKAARPGRLNVIALEGNPGIGKTTALTRYLRRQQDGFLFLYVSPRVVINRDVTETLARDDGKPSGVLTVTTNAQLIASAERWHRQQVEDGKDTLRHIDGAVVADGVDGLVRPRGSVLVLTPEQEHEIEAAHAGSRLSKSTLSENEDLLQERSLLGVLAGMAQTTNELLRLNREVNRVVLTAALQGFRDKGGGKTTIQALSGLFKSDVNLAAGVRERREFAARMPNIVIMVDELAGDGAGAPFVHAVAQWARQQFIEPFEDETPPFKVVLVASDASLGNEVVFDRYLNAGDRTPDKVLVSKSPGMRAFRLAANRIRLGGGMRPTLHVMTNSFPASKLAIRYRVNLAAVRLQESEPGVMETPRRAVRRIAQEQGLENAVGEVRRALTEGAEQVIYFAQDKRFLRELQGALVDLEEHGLTRQTVAVLDSSVPGWRRKQLVEPATRDQMRVFLMTSSGARGVSFPKTDIIIAQVPRFNVEAALMEIAQLIYRGRGGGRDKVPRKLVMLVDDFLLHEGELDLRQWLRQSLDLMTLLVMLRATIFTRITGDAGLKQSLALVPVGGVGLEELMTLMSTYVGDFVREAETFVRSDGVSRELAGLVSTAKDYAIELFSRFRVKATAKKGNSGASFVRPEDARQFLLAVAPAISPLLVPKEARPAIPDYAYFCGPVVLEHWSEFDKQEAFAFEGWETQTGQMTKRLFMMLGDIDDSRDCPSALRVPAANLRRVLARDKPGAANEFTTLKDLKSPNTWVALPVAYPQFMHEDEASSGRVRVLAEPGLWQEGLGRALTASGGAMPAVARYDDFPWAAAVGQTTPMRFDQVFDDRYFMASNELNLLNTMLLTADEG